MAVETGEQFKPLPGDIGVCWYCGSKNLVNDEGQLVVLDSETEQKLTMEERSKLQRSWELWNSKFSIRGS